MCVCVCVCVYVFSCVHLFAISWTIAPKAPLSRGFASPRGFKRIRHDLATKQQLYIYIIYIYKYIPFHILFHYGLLLNMNIDPYVIQLLVAQSCPTLCEPMDCSPPGSSVHGIVQARILEWVAVSFSRGSSQPRDGTCAS